MKGGFDMRFLCAIALFPLVLFGACPARAGGVVCPLTLTATADRVVILAQPRQNAALATATLTDIAPISLSVTLTNTGAAPLTVDTYDLVDSHLQVDVTGPRGDSVVLPALIIWDRVIAKPTAADYPVLQPGQSWSFQHPVAFPRPIGYPPLGFRDFGVYHLRLLYINLPRPLGTARRAWIGAVGSNEITLNVEEASAPVQGLQIALHIEHQVSQDQSAAPNRFILTTHLRNVSNKPLVLPTWGVVPGGLQILDDSGQPLPEEPAAPVKRTVRPEALQTTLEPGEQQDFPIVGQYQATGFGDAPVGTFRASFGDGETRTWKVHGGSVFFKAALAFFGASPTASSVCHLETPRQVRYWDLTRYYQTRLEQKRDQFTLRLVCEGAQDKPFYSLILSARPIPAANANLFEPSIVLTHAQTTTLIDALARDGFLRDAQPLERAASADPGTGYEMTITGGDSLSIPLGWDLAMFRRLQALQPSLPQAARPGLTSLLDRLEEFRTIWEMDEARERPVTVTIPAGDLASSVHALCAAIGQPTLNVVVSEAVARDPVYGVTFGQVPARTAFDLVAWLAGARVRLVGSVLHIDPVVARG